MIKVPRIKVGLISFLITFLILLFLVKLPVYSQSISDLEKQINEKTEQIAEKQGILGTIEKKIAEIKGSSKSLSEKIALMTAEVNKLQASIDENQEKMDEKVKGIKDKQEQLEKTKEILDVVSGKLYVESRGSVINFFLSDWDGLIRGFHVKKNTVSVLRREVEKINGEFSSLAEAKAALDKEREDLDKQKEDLDKSYALLADEKAKLQAELNKQNAQKKNLTVQIGGLTKEISQLQQFLLYARSGGTVVDTSMIPTNGKDVASTPDYFRQNAPPGSFAVFSFGAYTWRRGLSQYGADVRALLGQNYQQILSAYYSGSAIGNATIGQITVRFCDRSSQECKPCKVCCNPSFQTYDFETEYMPRIAEMPDNFAMEALKAQAVSARTYAIWRTNYGTTYINSDECDQAFNPNIVIKPNWQAAMAATKDQVLTRRGTVFETSYAAVHGGYSYDIGWDTIDGSSSIAQMYEAKSTRVGSYWFYRQWFRYGYTISGNDCGHTTPWLNNEEMSDILNGYLRLKEVDSDPRVIAIDIKECYSGDERYKYANPYSHQELRNIVPNPVTQIYSVITYNSGFTDKVSFNTNRGVVEMIGSDFKTAFGLRAPGYFRIPQNGFIHINIEKK